jgi:glycine/D-amino acid oxidase-like deaminating enzyme
MPGRKRDVVVIGGGHSGLACATYLARAELDVLLERRDILGGAAVTEAGTNRPASAPAFSSVHVPGIEMGV